MGTLIRKALLALSEDFEREGKTQLNDTRRRVLDLIVSPGVIGGKVQEDGGKTLRCELSLPLLSDAIWEGVIDRCAENRSTVALLLAGVVPDALSLAITELQEVLVPQEVKSFQGRCECQSKTRCRHLLTLLGKFSEKASEDPFLVLSLRGIGREELTRRLLDAAHRQKTIVPAVAEAHFFVGENLSEEKASFNQFWECAPEMFGLTYQIRADELPAALLKRLDSVPVSEVSEDADSRFESAYEQVARRSQAFGLSLRKG